MEQNLGVATSSCKWAGKYIVWFGFKIGGEHYSQEKSQFDS